MKTLKNQILLFPLLIGLVFTSCELIDGDSAGATLPFFKDDSGYKYLRDHIKKEEGLATLEYAEIEMYISYSPIPDREPSHYIVMTVVSKDKNHLKEYTLNKEMKVSSSQVDVVSGSFTDQKVENDYEFFKDMLFTESDFSLDNIYENGQALLPDFESEKGLEKGDGYLKRVTLERDGNGALGMVISISSKSQGISIGFSKTYDFDPMGIEIVD